MGRTRPRPRSTERSTSAAGTACGASGSGRRRSGAGRWRGTDHDPLWARWVFLLGDARRRGDCPALGLHRQPGRSRRACRREEVRPTRSASRSPRLRRRVPHDRPAVACPRSSSRRSQGMPRRRSPCSAPSRLAGRPSDARPVNRPAPACRRRVSVPVADAQPFPAARGERGECRKHGPARTRTPVGPRLIRGDKIGDETVVAKRAVVGGDDIFDLVRQETGSDRPRGPRRRRRASSPDGRHGSPRRRASGHRPYRVRRRRAGGGGSARPPRTVARAAEEVDAITRSETGEPLCPTTDRP